jgi:hypothetical protein
MTNTGGYSSGGSYTSKSVWPYHSSISSTAASAAVTTATRRFSTDMMEYIDEGSSSSSSGSSSTAVTSAVLRSAPKHSGVHAFIQFFKVLAYMMPAIWIGVFASHGVLFELVALTN